MVALQKHEDGCFGLYLPVYLYSILSISMFIPDITFSLDTSILKQ